MLLMQSNIQHPRSTIRGGSRAGVSLIEVLISMLLIVLASIATLQYFGPTKGYIAKSGNRRAALERARQRLEQLMEAPSATLPPQDGQLYWCTTAGNPCGGWTASGTPLAQTGGVPVGNLQGTQPLQVSVQAIHDPAAGTPVTNFDTTEFSAKVWFLPGPAIDDDFHRVHVRTLRTIP